jgi:hypothetical protein
MYALTKLREIMKTASKRKRSIGMSNFSSLYVGRFDNGWSMRVDRVLPDGKEIETNKVYLTLESLKEDILKALEE